eukprot:Nitzschia sp. Nitz4//scaffold113_size70149//59725//60696//NITZ4_005962-RA/size70149-processed-gene-0.80-mRNA-1//-1//CDS//3329533377//8//frame0
MSITEVTSSAPHLGGKKKAVLLFGAPWHDGCSSLKQLLTVLATTSSEIFFGSVQAEQVEALTTKYQVTVVPTLIFLNGESVFDRIEGAVEPAKVTVTVQRLQAATESETQAPETKESLTDRLNKLISSDSVMLFMKGVPDAPKCGFSRQAVELLNEEKVPFGSFNILSDNEVRQGLKTHSNWPTYPQIYVNGELQGGLDILKELAEEGSLLEQWGLEANTQKDSLNDRLGKLVRRSDVMLFMKGLPSAPKCGFSRQIVEMLDQTGVAYDAFDILQDDEVRQGLKSFSNWPTYPQLYAKGELVGGLDICKELQESGDLMDALQG